MRKSRTPDYGWRLACVNIGTAKQGSGSKAPPRRTIVADGTRSPAAVDPGSKGKRVAWKTSVGPRAGRDMKRTMMRSAIDLPATREMDGERTVRSHHPERRATTCNLIRNPGR